MSLNKSFLQFLFLCLILLLPLRIYASESLFLYEENVIQQVSLKKEPIQEVNMREIFQYTIKTKPVTIHYYTQTVFNNLKKENTKYDIYQKLALHIPPPKKDTLHSKTLDHYFSNLGKKDSHSVSVITKLKEYKQETTFEKHFLLSETYFQNNFPKVEKDYFFFLSKRKKETNQETYSQKLEEENINIPTSSEKSEVSFEKEVTNSTTVRFSLTILPVRFVYIDSNREIVKIWNNVKKVDSKYVLKFLDENENEIIPSEKLSAQYFKILKNIDTFGQGLIYEKEKGLSLNNYSRSVDLNINEYSSRTEEVYTLI